ncbi:hypothetical protein ACFQ88_36675 [Paenibacillus sp. NPDC056579]|uniref:hypothetical protein n=1 Tax=unclassified Paenibacillus TaxID=185978 RepID=UPI001EF83E61|nr:hypothetical protein [Paenibacillus sp. H1-7]ULL19060.1 hypothetical protein DVH26_34300 [Paenibacillus sp. H1-7]
MIARYRRCAALALLMGMCMVPFSGLAAELQQLSESSVPSGKAIGPDPAKLLLLSIPGFSFLELEQPDAAAMPVLTGLGRRGAWGSMNIRTPGRGLEDVYLSLGAGHFAEGSPGVQGMQREERVQGEPAGQRYRRYGGHETDSAIVVKEAEAMRRQNASNYYKAQPGLLGEKLRAAGIRLSVWGNADRAGAAKPGTMPEKEARNMHRRYAPLMLMDGSSTVPSGDVSGAGLLRDPLGPAGWRTNYPWLLKRWLEQPSPSVTLMELGDFQRLYDEKSYYSDEAFAIAKRSVLAEMDRFIGQIVRTMDSGTPGDHSELWMFSPQVHADAVKQKAYLGPLLIVPSKGTEQNEGLLTSATTRRQGIVSLVDIAPTLLGRFGLPGSEEMIGLPIQAEQEGAGLETLLSQVREMRQIYALRPPLLYGLAIYEVAVMLLVLIVAMFAGERIGQRTAAVGKALLFSLLLAPAGLLSMGWLPGEPSGWTAAVALGAVAALSAGCAVYSRKPGGFAACLAGSGSLVTLLLLYDGMHGAKAMQRSVLGYDPMIGARYYGMGNECMGVLLGAALLGLTALQQAVLAARRQSRSAAASDGGAGLPPAQTAEAQQPAAAAVPGSGSHTPALLHGAPEPQPSGRAAWRLTGAGTLAPWLRARGPIASAVAAHAAAPGTRRRSRLAARAAAVWRAWPAAAVGAAVAGYLAAPALGTNAGGALSAAVGFGALGARLASGRRWLRTAPALALLLGAALVLLWLLNPSAATTGGGQSHIGRAFDTLLQGRLDIIWAIIVRKLQMNWHLIGVSAWSKVLLTSMVVMAVLVLRPRGLFRRWQRRYPYIMYGCAANVIGAIAALLLNDSGIVAAGTMIIYSSVPLLLLKLEGA